MLFIWDFPFGFWPATGVVFFRDFLPARQVCKVFPNSRDIRLSFRICNKSVIIISDGCKSAAGLGSVGLGRTGLKTRKNAPEIMAG
jgi:hypothetical protein